MWFDSRVLPSCCQFRHVAQLGEGAFPVSRGSNRQESSHLRQIGKHSPLVVDLLGPFEGGDGSSKVKI